MTQVRQSTEIFKSLRHVNYRYYFFGQLVSTSGTWMQTAAQSWLVYRLTGSGALLGLVAAAGQIPSLFVGLLAGAAADRFNRRRLLMLTQTLSLIQALILTWLTATGLVQVWHVFFLALTLGTIAAFETPARQAFASRLVPKEDMGNAIALSGILLNLSRLTGPALAGFMIARVGEAACFGLNAVSYLAVLVSLWMISWRQPESTDAEEGEWSRIKLGLHYSFDDPERRLILLLLTAVSMTALPLISILPIFSQGLLKAGPQGYGILFASYSVGALMASGLLAKGFEVEELPRLIGRAAVVFGIAVIILSVIRILSAACFVTAVAGWGMMTCFSGGNIRLQDRASDAMRGRVMGLFAMTFMATSPFGMLAMGWASDRFGATVALASGGIACILCASFFLFGLSQMRLPQRGIQALVVAVLLMCSRSALAEPKLVDWNQCVEAATAVNPELASSRFSLESSRSSFYQSLNGIFPQVTLSNSLAQASTPPSERWSLTLRL
jgi:MFS family permease